MRRPWLALAALLLASLSAGFGLCMTFVHYPTWRFVPGGAFQPFHDASGAHTVALALLVGLPNLAAAGLMTREKVPGTPRALLWLALALAALPWVVTPLYFIPLQGLLHVSGPTPELLARLTSADLLVRTAPSALQAGIYFCALVRAFGVAHAGGLRLGRGEGWRAGDQGPTFGSKVARLSGRVGRNEHVGR